MQKLLFGGGPCVADETKSLCACFHKFLTGLWIGDRIHGTRQILRIIATDPGSVKDFAAFAKQTGNELLASAEKDKEFEFFMKRK